MRDLAEVLVIGPLLGLLVVSPFLVPGLLVWWIRRARVDRVLGQARDRWRQTPGVVLMSELRNRPQSDADPARDRSWPVSVIEYAYRVGEREYRGRQVWPVPIRRRDTRAHMDAVSRYRVRQQVTVHYDPGAPGHSALELTAPGPSANALAWMRLVAVGAALAGTLVALAIRMLRT